MISVKRSYENYNVPKTHNHVLSVFNNGHTEFYRLKAMQNYSPKKVIRNLNDFLSLKPCQEAQEYVKHCDSLSKAWEECKNIDWMLWLVAHCDRECLNKILSIIVKRAKEKAADTAADTAAAYAAYAASYVADDAYAAYAASYAAASYAAAAAETAAYAAYAYATATAETAAAYADAYATERNQQIADIKANFTPFS